MASPTLESLQKQLTEISSEYAVRFSGHSRATRNLAELDELITRTRGVIERLESLPKSIKDAQAAALLESARSDLNLYLSEHTEISKAKAQGTHLQEFVTLGTHANFVFARYRRHFASKNRRTRDVGLLGEMIEDLTKIQNRMRSILEKHNNPGFIDDLTLVSENLKLYVSERVEISKARASGSLDDQASVWAEVANNQFKLYTEHFADQSRLTRRPALLQRMLDSLKQVKEAMVAIEAEGLAEAYNRENIKVIDGYLSLYSNEITEIKRLRTSTRLVDLMAALGDAANDVMVEYEQHFAGQDRVTRDLERASKLCDQLGEVIRQMADLGRAEINEMNIRNLAITMDNLVMLEHEYQQIQEAQQAKTNVS